MEFDVGKGVVAGVKEGPMVGLVKFSVLGVTFVVMFVAST